MEHIPEEAEEIINSHINMIEREIPGFLESYYIYGSVSLGAFDYGMSDIDFIIITKREIAESDINVLKKIHSQMRKKYRKTILDGSYISKHDMESLNKGEVSCIRFNDGVFKGIKKLNINSIDFYQLKKYGITIKGQEIDSLKYTVNWDILIDNMKNNLNTYWANWVNDCKKFLSIKYIGLFYSLKMVEWGVLGVSRLYYTFKEKDITSKLGAGEYALRTVPERYHKIINESMRLRRGIKKSYYNSVFERRNDAIAYMYYIIKEINRRR